MNGGGLPAEVRIERPGESRRVVPGDRVRGVQVVAQERGHARIVRCELVDPLQPLDRPGDLGRDAGRSGPGQVGLDRLGPDCEVRLVRGEEAGHPSGEIGAGPGAGDRNGTAGDLAGQDAGREGDLDLGGEEARVVGGLLAGAGTGNAGRYLAADQK